MAIQSLFESLQTCKRCSGCGEAKPLTQFNVRRRHGDICDYFGRCKACQYKKTLEYRKENPEKHRERAQKFKQKRLSCGPDLSIKLKSCKGCNLTLPISSFGKTYTSENGYRSKCKKCMSREKCNWAKTPRGKKKYHDQYARKRERLTTEGYRWRRIKQKYGISQAEYEALLSSQNGKCGICFTGTPTRGTFAVDHCHDTGRIRGLLCSTCNSGIGLLKDKLEILEAAVAYMRRHLHV